MKVFGIGLNKTGTTTLGLCLRTLGYRHMGCRRDLLEKYRAGSLDEIFPVLDRYESFEDWPYPLMYRELFARYGDSARFILTVRRSPEVWLESLKKHSLRTSIRHCRKLAFGYDFPHYAEAEHLRFYTEHNRQVVDFFRREGASDRLRILCWETGDGWPELCAFLGHPVPDQPFPHANRAAERWLSPRRVVNEVWRRYAALSQRSAT